MQTVTACPGTSHWQEGVPQLLLSKIYNPLLSLPIFEKPINSDALQLQQTLKPTQIEATHSWWYQVCLSIGLLSIYWTTCWLSNISTISCTGASVVSFSNPLTFGSWLSWLVPKTLSLFPISVNYTKFHIFWVVFQLNLSYWKRRWYTKVPEGTRELVE